MSDCDCQTEAVRDARDETLHAAYLAGVRAGLRAAGEVCRAERARVMALADRLNAGGHDLIVDRSLLCVRAIDEVASLIAALDAEEVAG